MSGKWKWVLIFLALAGVSIIGLLMVWQATVSPMVARGTGPNGVTIYPGGWIALLSTLAGSIGFPIAAAWAAFQKGDLQEAMKIISSSAGRLRPASGTVTDYKSLFDAARDDEKPLIAQLAWKRTVSLFREAFGDVPAEGGQQ